MAKTVASMARAARDRDRIRTLLGARRGGTTRAEVADILDMDNSRVSFALRRLRQMGEVAIHGHPLREIPLYTLADDPLTRPIARKVATEKRRTLYRTRVRIILAALEDGPKRHATLARLCGASKAERRFGILDTLQRMVAEGLIERTGESVRARYRKRQPSRVAAA